MRALLDTSRDERAGRGRMAAPCVPLSRQHQTQDSRPGCSSPAAVTHDQRQDWSASCRAGFVITVHDTWLGGALRGSVCQHRDTHWSRLSSLAATNCGVSSVRALPRINSAKVRLAGQSIRTSLPNQRLVDASADRLHHQVLSSSAVSVGIDPNENGLTHEAELLSPDDKIHD